MPTYNITEVNINQEDSNGRVDIVEQPLISDVTLSVLGSEAEVNIAETTQISDVNILQESGESEVNFVEVPQITKVNINMVVQGGGGDVEIENSDASYTATATPPTFILPDTNYEIYVGVNPTPVIFSFPTLKDDTINILWQ
jgi:hypothetical protein